MSIDGFGSLASITVLCMVVGQLLKITPVDKKYLPVAVAIIGGILGGLAFGFNWVPNFPATNVMDAICVGVTSGLASSGLYDAFDNFKSAAKIEEQ